MTLLRDCLIVTVLWIVLGTPSHLAFEQPVDPCATGETPCNPEKPWMRGNTEKYCGRKEHLALLREKNPGKTIEECACKHACDPQNPHAAETNDRQWDAACGARCNPNNCACKHPCEE
jgi:hypothetical protein